MRWWILLAIGCGSVEGDKKTDAAVPRDAASDTQGQIDAPAAPCDLAKPFGTPVPIDGANSAGDERFGFLSTDELTIYFSDVDADRDIWQATRASTSAAFSNKVILPTVNVTGKNEEHPSITANGLMLVYETSSLGNTVDLVYATRTNTTSDFGAMAEVPGVNGANTQELDAQISANGLTIAFGSNRVNNEYEIFIATRGSITTAFGTPMHHSELGSTMVDSNPVLSADGREIYFSSDRNGNHDIFRATRAQPSGAFGAPVPVTELNSASVEITSWLSADGCRTILTSDRLGTYDMYMATRPQ